MSAKKAAAKAAPKKAAARKPRITTGNRKAKDVDAVNIADVLESTIGKGKVHLKGGALYLDDKFVGTKGDVKAAINKLFRRARLIED